MIRIPLRTSCYRNPRRSVIHQTKDLSRSARTIIFFLAAIATRAKNEWTRFWHFAGPLLDLWSVKTQSVSAAGARRECNRWNSHAAALIRVCKRRSGAASRRQNNIIKLALCARPWWVYFHRARIFYMRSRAIMGNSRRANSRPEAEKLCAKVSRTNHGPNENAFGE